MVTAFTGTPGTRPEAELRLAKMLRQLLDQVIERFAQAAELAGVEHVVGAGEAVRINKAEVMMATFDRLQIEKARLEHGLQYTIDQRLSGPVGCGRVRAVQCERIGRQQCRLYRGQPWQLCQQ
ncbi:MAG: hypothetical protein ACN6PW_24640 [Pseudomonas kermanshahensis]|uniref:hypothetical protein n=1 Tax=Pseudomonas kermanshahensis TaxID=2745482 RepID=UPI003D152C8E